MNDKIEGLLSEIAMSISHCKETDNGLFTGRGGLALYEIEYGLHFNKEEYISTGISFVEEIFNKIGSGIKDSFCSGLSGIGWLLHYQDRRKWELFDDTNTLLLDIDRYLIRRLDQYLLINYWDFLHGYIGIGHYLLSRIPDNEEARGAILSILAKLEGSAVRDCNNGVKWNAIVDLKAQTFRYNISLSHGMSGVLIFLLKLFESGIEKKRVLHLIEGTVNYLLSQEIDYEKYNSFFPTFSLENEDDGFRGSRLSWCYGDLGVCFALWQSGIKLQNEVLQNKALNMLIHLARFRKDLNESGIKDACFCHGTAGVGHVFYRMWLNTEIEYFKSAADYWLNETVKLSKFPDGPAGYKAYYDREKGYINQYDLLNGIAGIGMVLLSFLSGEEPSWDECFLLS